MTIKEAILSNSILSETEGAQIEKALISRSINGREVFSPSTVKEVELITADLYLEILVSPEFKEGNLVIKHDKGALREFISKVGARYEDETLLNGLPGIEGVRLW